MPEITKMPFSLPLPNSQPIISVKAWPPLSPAKPASLSLISLLFLCLFPLSLSPPLSSTSSSLAPSWAPATTKDCREAREPCWTILRSSSADPHRWASFALWPLRSPTIYHYLRRCKEKSKLSFPGQFIKCFIVFLFIFYIIRYFQEKYDIS